MGSSQFSEWMAYSSIEPFGQYRDELRHGQQMALVCNINRDSKNKPEPYQPVDFMNFFDTPKIENVVCDQDRIDREVFRL